MKKVIGLLVALCVMLGVATNTAVTVNAEEYSNGYYYEVENGTAVFSGINEDVIKGDVVIPATLGGYPVKRIGNRAFEGCVNITSVVIPEGVVEIGELVFYGCSGMKKIEFPKTLKRVDQQVLYGCDNLTSITVPSGVTRLGEYALAAGKKLKTVFVNSNSVSIGKQAIGSYWNWWEEEPTCMGKDFTLVAKKGSKAEAYAKKNNLKFVEYSSAQKISSISKLKGGLKVKWKKNSTATGYKIRYSLNKNMSGAKTITISKNKTTSKKITKLKKKTKYYVQIRSYKKVNGITFYGDWSAVKSQTTK